ncbi:cyclic-di-AMP receptor [Bacillus horti]|uniref:Uncharacterized protein YaaQ n=1 Tax=Caldalkalibacillus horti TaxID=77523 RepID=A0ABT9W1J3_9BACI|nr:cyclic-di-AMP receptor [Bacillus horti]MDQ0167081.1 uncharacterized protein YaaQ [Bacillus horti]
MKLMICITNKKYGSSLIKTLGKNGYGVTKLASTGGFLKEGNDTLLIGVGNQDVSELKQLMKASVEELEKQKGWKPKEHRFTSFVINGQNFLPLLHKNKHND